MQPPIWRVRPDPELWATDITNFVGNIQSGTMIVPNDRNIIQFAQWAIGYYNRSDIALVVEGQEPETQQD